MQNQEKLNQAIADFEHWRQTRASKHVNIPDELRQQAVKLLENYRVGQITKALRICSTQINTWRKQFLVEQAITPNFITLQVEPDLTHKPSLKLQLTLPNSTQIHICGNMSPDLLRALIQEAGEQ
jgi:transposase-like protein